MPRFLGVAALLIIGCGRDADLERRVALLENRVAAMAEAQADQEKRLKLAELELLSVRLDATPRTAGFSPSSTGYSPVRTNSEMVLFVSLESVAPYAGGFRGQFRVGNASTAVLEGVRLLVACGELDGVCSGESKPADVRPGGWTRFEVAFGPAKTADIQAIRVKVNSDQMVLSH